MKNLKLPDVSRAITAFSLKFPWLVFLGVAVLTVLSLYGVSRLKIDNDLMHWLPENDRYVKIFKEVDEKFGSSEIGFILVRKRNGDVFDPSFLSALRLLVNRVKSVEGVNDVVSLVNYMDIKLEDGTVEVAELVPEGMESDPSFVARLRNYVLNERRDFFVSRVISSDGKTLLVQVDFSRNYPVDSTAKKVKEAFLKEVSRLGLSKNCEIGFSGFPFAQLDATETVKKDMARLISIIVFFVVAVLFFVFRSPRGVLFPFLVVVLATLFSMGFIAAIGEKLDMALEVLPVLIVALGVDYAIHFYHHFVHLRREDLDAGKVSLLTVEKVGMALFLAFITTFISFSSFLTSDMHIIRKFGVFSALGILFVYLLTVSLLPALLKVLPPHRKEITKEGIAFVGRLAHSLALFVKRNSRKIVFASFVFVAIGALSFFFVRTEINFINYFPENSPLRKSYRMVERDFSGSLSYMLYFEGNMRSPAGFRELLKASAWMKSLERGARPVSMAYLLMELNHYMSGKWALPETTEEMENLLFFFEGNEQVSKLWKNDAALTTVFLKGTSSAFAKMIYRRGLSFLPTLNGEYLYVSEDSLDDPELVFRYNKKDATSIVYNVLLPYTKDFEFTVSYAMDDFLRKFLKRKKYLSVMKFRKEFRSAVESSMEEIYRLDVRLDPEDLASRVEDYLVGEMGYPVSPFACKKFAQLYCSGYDVAPAVKMAFGGLSEEEVSMIEEDLMVFVRDYTRAKRVENGILLLQRNLESYLNFAWDELDGETINYIKSALWILFSDHALVPSVAISGYENSPWASSSKFTFRAEQTGLPPIFSRAISRVNGSLVSSFSLTLLLIFLILLLNFASFKDAFLGMSAIITAVMLNFFMMVLIGIPLTPQTAFVSAVTIGLGIDYTIHFSSRYRRELLSDPENALENTFRETGSAMLSSAATDVVGFLVLLLATLLPVRQFGLLLAFTIAVSAVGALTILPAFLSVFKGFSLKRTLKGEFLKIKK